MYSDEIQKVRNEAQETNVANKIMNLLENLQLTSNEYNSRRWIWELIQNAKDVVNSTGKVDINISFDEDKDIIKFEHNGKLFSTKNLVYLIEQVSTKDREKSEKQNAITGKFGTGFLTTHLLSEKVNVTGILQDDEKVPREFEIELDRSGKNETDIIKAIKKSYKQLYDCQELSSEVLVKENGLNTAFIYKLSGSGIEVAKKGLDDLYIGLPYVFAFVPELGSLSVDTYNWYFSRGNIYNSSHENIKVYEIVCVENGEERRIYICVLEKENVSIAIEVTCESSFYIQEYSHKLPRIFCDFPLIGTEDFSFPVVINSSKFNPNDPRDGIFLSDNTSHKIDENKLLIVKARELYLELLEYASKQNWQNIYNIVKIRPQKEKSWLSKSWLKDNIIEKCKDYIINAPIVDSHNGERKALYDWIYDEPEIWIISDNNVSIREKIWDLAVSIIPNTLTRRLEIHNWYNSLWEKCHNFALKDLVIKVEEMKKLQNLSESFEKESETIKWLSELYALVSEDKKTADYVLNEKIKIFPNQNGDFCSFEMLSIDSNIDEVYKDILYLLEIDCRTKLLNTKVLVGEWITFEKYSYDEVFNEIKDSLKWKDDKEDDVYKQIIVLYDSTNKENDEQIRLIDFVDIVFPDYLPDDKEVNMISNDLLEDAMRHLCTCIADKISSYENITDLSNNIVISDGKTIEEWLADFIEYLVEKDYVNLLNKKTKPILPNQNGVFKTKDELFQDSGEADEVLKDISRIAGNDVREELLLKDIYLALPYNRTRGIEDIAQDIISYIKMNQGVSKSQEPLIKDTLKKFYVWLSENQGKVETYFSEVWSNKHWLFDDYEIAENMKKAEVLDDILKKYDIHDSKKLEEILTYNQSNNYEQMENKIEITEEQLIQSGIHTKEALEKAMSLNIFDGNFVHESEQDNVKFKYVNEILERSKVNVINFLESKSEYDFSEMIELDKTIFLIKKHGEEMYLIIRPSDYKQVILYYDSEKDILDYEKDWELWVEDGTDNPEKITFGKMLKLTGINKIPLKRIR